MLLLCCCCVGLCYSVVGLLVCFVVFYVRCLLFACVVELTRCWLDVVMRYVLFVCLVVRSFVCVGLFVSVFDGVDCNCDLCLLDCLSA